MDRLYTISDALWVRIEPLLPDRAPRRGGRWTDHRVMLDAMCWRFRAGTPWRDLPPEFPPWQTVWHRFNRWAADGTFERIQRSLQGDAHAAGVLDWVVSIDSTVTRAHQHAAGARRLRGGAVESQESAA